MFIQAIILKKFIAYMFEPENGTIVNWELNLPCPTNNHTSLNRYDFKGMEEESKKDAHHLSDPKTEEGIHIASSLSPFVQTTKENK